MLEITPEILEQLRLVQQQKKEPLKKESVESLEASTLEPSLPENFSDITFHTVENDQGNVIQKIPLKDGIPHGMMEEFDDQKDLVSQIFFDQGQKNGLSIFYIKGQKVVETTFVKDILEGPFVTYHTNGQINTTGTYTHGMMDQEFCIYDDQGHLLKKEQYQSGYKEGLSQNFYPNGTLYEEVLFSKDIPVGDSKTYHMNQSLMMLKQYKDGMVIYEEVHDDRGNLIEKKSMDSQK
jgi:antitoxin component YwqK of YwqJK toxin-antitoxin module